MTPAALAEPRIMGLMLPWTCFFLGYGIITLEHRHSL